MPLCWFESGESALLGLEVMHETTEKVKMILKKTRASQSRHKSYHDKSRKDIEFQVDDHVFLRVNPVTGVGRALKCWKLTPRFVGPFEIGYKLRKYVYDVSHVIQVYDLEVRDNLTVETWLVRSEDQKVKRLREKENVLVKVLWVGPTGESSTWESESRMRVSYPKLFSSRKEDQKETVFQICVPATIAKLKSQLPKTHKPAIKNNHKYYQNQSRITKHNINITKSYPPTAKHKSTQTGKESSPKSTIKIEFKPSQSKHKR
ncbi:hypothetical protein MTR_0058s0150 [Medicago truncatula]|uniref:Chromo domain-containing protein n=1 Tax=Medicago truncatula TaxID=3880 RepID=A0A072THT0_MEDTR|nr:hypothetical protein MTR_0058s0150 [Medicago truncatula]